MNLSGSPLSRSTTRLAGFWYLYMCGWGIFFPYYTLYLKQEIGLSAAQAGLVMATIPLVGLFAQPFWGHLADRTGRRRQVLATISSGTGMACALLLLMHDLPSAILATAVFALFSTSGLPMATSTTLASVGREGIGRFGLIRMWGTLGFLTMILLFPPFLAWMSGDDVSRGDVSSYGALFPRLHGLAWIFPITGSFLLVAALVALSLPDSKSITLRSKPGETARLLRNHPLIRLLILTFVAHFCMQGPINFFPLFIEERGGDVATIGRMWIFMLLLEIPLVGFSGHTLRQFGARGLLTIGLMAEGVRWTTCAFTDNMILVTAAQLLHGVSVAGVLVGASLYVEQAVPEGLRSTAQAILAAVSFGAGAILSNLTFGWLLHQFGPGPPYAAAGFGTLILGLLTHQILPTPQPPPGEARNQMC